MNTHSIEQTLIALGIELPSPPKPAGNYLPWMICGPWLYISGQVPIENGRLLHTGRVGAELSAEEGRAAARLTGLNVLAQICEALGGFDRLAHLVRVEGHVACASGEVDAPWVLDAASDLFLEVLGDRGRHTRTAFSPGCLPKNLTLELVVTAMLRS
jgi:enamine deaminase RidA (YjgF/YER057c/UK114 family)